MRWTAQQNEQFAALWHSGLKPRAIMREMKLTAGQVAGKAMRLNLHYQGAARAFDLHSDHPAVREGRSLFPTAVRDPVDGISLLKDGRQSRKLGVRVLKGTWKGFPIFSLTLEERATCPRSCVLFERCYGNHMPFARRWKAGPALEAKIENELAALSDKYPRGFVVRLHLLGDFYSVAYVALWRAWLSRFPALRVFGYTAWPAGTAIGDAVIALATEQWARFAVRRSGGTGPEPSTIVIAREQDAPAGSIACPAQTGKTQSCSTCALCWATKKQIAFLQH